MKKTTTLIIEKNIEDVFSFIEDDSTEKFRKINPRIIEIIPLKIAENKIGSTYIQKGKSLMSIKAFIYTVTDYLNESDVKIYEIQSELPKKFHMTERYELKYIDEFKTEIKCTAIVIPLNFFLKILFTSHFVIFKYSISKNFKKIKSIIDGKQ